MSKIGNDASSVPLEQDVLGELCFTHYYCTLEKFVGISFGISWKHLNLCEQQAWNETGKMMFELGGELSIPPSAPAETSCPVPSD